MTRARRKTPSKDLVPIKHPDWDQQVKDVLDDVHRYARTKPGGYRTPPDTRRALALDAESRLHGLVDQLDTTLRGGVSEQDVATRVWPLVGDEAGF